MTVRHHLTVDVEEFFHSTLLSERIPRAEWEGLPRRAPAMIDWILERMDDAGARGTFFVLGWLGEREPDMVRTIADAGHEVASHGWAHRTVGELGPEGFRASVRRSKHFLEDLIGRGVEGYRAPSFSIAPGLEWAFDILLEEGYTYDSTLFPISIHPDYGYAGARAEPHWIERASGSLIEIPPATLRFATTRLPAAGGAYLRLLPGRFVRSALRQAARQGYGATVYIHPWDLDPGIERVPLPTLLKLRIFAGADAARRRLGALLSEFSFFPIQDTARAMRADRDAAVRSPPPAT